MKYFFLYSENYNQPPINQVLNLNMYTTTTATREQVLKAVAATQRVMKRQVCCKSQFKFMCFSCGEFINRGDKITRCIKKTTGMTLRYRRAGGECGLTMDETAFYQANTGKNMWVHIGCQPCYWDKGFDNGDESSPPGLRVVPTEWGCKIDREFEDWTSGPGGESWLIMGVPYFLKVKGYPKEKSMKDRIIQAVTRFQALWRGYIYKKAYPIALQQHRKLLRTSPQIGEHTEILFNANERTESLYSGEVIEVQYRGIQDTKIKVKFHYDGEVRKYTGKKFNLLKREGEQHKRKRGIEASFTGRIFTNLSSTKKKKQKQDDEGDLFLLDY